MSATATDEHLWERAVAPMRAGDFAEAANWHRAQFVQYVQWVRQHTVPLLKGRLGSLKAMGLSQSLVAVDVDALESICDSVAFCLARQARGAEIRQFLNHAENIIPLRAFGPRATYLRALWTYLALDDAEGARAELAAIEVEKSDHHETIELYIDVFNSTLSPRKKLLLAQRILQLVSGDSEARAEGRVAGLTFHYSSVCALCYLMLGETKNAEDVLAEATRSKEPIATPESDARISHNLHLARALCLLGKLRNDQSLLVRAESILRSIPDAGFTAAGKAQLMMDLGRVLMDREEYADAAVCFTSADGLNGDTVTKIHLADAQALAKQFEAASKTLASVPREDLPEGLALEYLQAAAHIAMGRNDRDTARGLAATLKRLDEREPYFAQHRDRMIIALQDFVVSPENSIQVQPSGKMVGFLMWINRYGELKPNVLGLGVNLNEILETLIARLSKPKVPQD